MGLMQWRNEPKHLGGGHNLCEGIGGGSGGGGGRVPP